jgi:peptidoglycan hydrolase-like protein with peptidoglycan-binding domain
METIAFGSRGSSVIELQGILGLTKDGIFGADTREAVKAFQKENGLTPDGFVGPNTWSKLLNQTPKLKIDETVIKKIIEANSEALTSKLNNKNNKTVSFNPAEHIIVVAIRGFNEDMGVPNQNDRRIYDDAHFICSPKGIVMFEGNTDPNGFRKGSGFGSSKGMAVLNNGVWFYGKGSHNGRPSFRQCAPVQVTRDGNPPYLDFGWFGINWHSGGDTTTSSLGCQTNRPKDYEKLRDYLYKELDVFNNPKLCTDWAKNFNDSVRSFPYILIDFDKIEKGIYKV